HQGVRFAAAGTAKASQHRGRLRRIADHRAALAFLPRLSGCDSRQPVAGGNAAVEPLDLPQRGGRLEVADQHQRAIVRRVVGAEVSFALLARDRLDVAHPADHRPAVGVGEEGQRAERLVEHPVDVVVRAEAALFLHHIPLPVEGSVIDQERRHPVRFQIQHQRQRLGGEVLVVRGEIVRRVGVGGAARRFQASIELLRAVPLRPVEHHVLEEVGTPGDAGALVAGTDAEEAVERAYRQRAIREEPDLQPVAQTALLDGEVLLRKRHQSSLGGSTGFIRSCSAGVISFLRLLHSLQAAATFPLAPRPPRATGTTWSMVSDRGGTVFPQYPQTPRWRRRCHQAVLRSARAFSLSRARWAGSAPSSNHSSIIARSVVTRRGSGFHGWATTFLSYKRTLPRPHLGTEHVDARARSGVPGGVECDSGRWRACWWRRRAAAQASPMSVPWAASSRSRRPRWISAT